MFFDDWLIVCLMKVKVILGEVYRHGPETGRREQF